MSKLWRARFVAVFDQDSEEAVYSCMRTETVCLAPAFSYHLQGLDLFGKGWEDATVLVSTDGTAATPLVFIDKFLKRSSVLRDIGSYADSERA